MNFLSQYLKILFVILLLIGPVVEAQNRSKKRIGNNRNQKPATQPSVPVTDEQQLALERLFKATTRLEESWRNRFRKPAPSLDTTELSVAGEQALAVVKSERIKQAIPQVVKAYQDAMSVHRLAENRYRNAAAETYSAADRERDVKEIKELKDRLYKEYDDPISRDQLRAQISLKESMMRLKHSQGGSSSEEDPLAKKVRQRNIDILAKRMLKPYGFEDEWPENAFTVVEKVMGQGARTAEAIQRCFQQTESCPTLAAETQALVEKQASTNNQSNSPQDALTGIWILEYTWGPNGDFKTPFEVEKQSGKYVAVFGDVKMTDIVVSGANFAFTFSFRPAVSLDNSNLRTATVSGTVQGDQIKGQFRVNEWTAGGYNITARTYPLTGRRLAP
jgi:hypothetical protein